MLSKKTILVISALSLSTAIGAAIAFLTRFLQSGIHISQHYPYLPYAGGALVAFGIYLSLFRKEREGKPITWEKTMNIFAYSVVFPVGIAALVLVFQATQIAHVEYEVALVIMVINAGVVCLLAHTVREIGESLSDKFDPKQQGR